MIHKSNIYFIFLINLFMLTMSTIMASVGWVDAMTHLRFPIAFRLPFTVPQLIGMPDLPVWFLHLPFRIYSMMMTTTDNPDPDEQRKLIVAIMKMYPDR